MGMTKRELHQDGLCREQYRSRKRDQEPLSFHIATLKSRSASFKLVLRSVLGLRWPMINAQVTWYSPAGNFFGYVPGITTLRAGTRPLYSTGSDPLTSMIRVDCVNTTFAPRTASFSTITPSTTMLRL